LAGRFTLSKGTVIISWDTCNKRIVLEIEVDLRLAWWGLQKDRSQSRSYHCPNGHIRDLLKGRYSILVCLYQLARHDLESLCSILDGEVRGVRQFCEEQLRIDDSHIEEVIVLSKVMFLISLTIRDDTAKGLEKCNWKLNLVLFMLTVRQVKLRSRLSMKFFFAL
jgi:hypothetical protein